MLDNLSKLHNRVYFSPGNDCLNAIQESLNSAKNSLKICVFTISDDRISEGILKAYKRGVDVKVLTDNEKLYDKGADIMDLAAKGVPVRVDMTQNHMHHKFAIIDNESVLTGSYNWTRSAANYNHENILITHDRDTVLAYCQEFDKLWKEMQEFEQSSDYRSEDWSEKWCDIDTIKRRCKSQRDDLFIDSDSKAL